MKKMKKVEFGLIALLVLTACSALCACGFSQALVVPQNICVEGRTLVWDEVENAEEYLVYVESENVEHKTKQPYYDLSGLPAPNTYAIEIMAVGDGVRFGNSDWISFSYEAEEPVEHGYDESGFEYTLLEDGSGYEVKKGKHNMSGVLTIPDYFKGLPVKSIPENGFIRIIDSTVTVNGITMGGIKYPNPETGYLCNEETTEIHLPKHLETIGRRGLGCFFLVKEITIPDTVTELGDYALWGNIHLRQVTLPKNLKEIPSNCFEDCALKEITFPETLEKIGNNAFLCNYVWAGSKTLVIGHSFTKIVIPDTVKSIGYGAFWGCKRLVDITLPKYLEYLGNGVFSDTAWYDAQPDGLVILENILYGYKGNMAEETKITIPSNVTEIAPYVFGWQKNLVEVIIPNSVTKIRPHAFYECVSLMSVTFENSNGWKVGATEIASEKLSDPALAAKCLASDYCRFVWTRSE